jgi:hypothetical protein
MQLELTLDTLTFFVDDTGHETLPIGHHVYGLGGCGLMAPELEPVVRAPWREVRRRVAGSPDAPLHASKLKVDELTQGQIEAITSFFTSQPMARIAVTVTSVTKLHPDLPTVELVSKALLNRMAEVAKCWQFGRMAVVIESSERADTLLQATLRDLRLEVDGAVLPAEIFFIPKSAHEPALEVADFLIHTAGAQAKWKVDGRSGFRRDYKAMYQSPDPKLVSRFDIDLVERASSAAPLAIGCA